MMDEPRARAALWLLAAYPFALFYSAAYTESLFLLAALGTWFHFRRDQSAASRRLGTARGTDAAERLLSQHSARSCWRSACATLRQRAPREGGLWRRLALAAMPGIGMLLFTAYLHQMTGSGSHGRRRMRPGAACLGGDDAARRPSAGSVPMACSVSPRTHPYDLLNALGLLLALLARPRDLATQPGLDDVRPGQCPGAALRPAGCSRWAA